MRGMVGAEASRGRVRKGPREAFGLYSKGDGRPREDLNRDSDNRTCVLKRLLWP